MQTRLIAAVLGILAFGSPAFARVTHYVRHTGSDSPNCGIDVATACRSISHAIDLAVAGDIINVGPGRYGDLNRNGVLGETGEETGSATCDCILAIEKRVIVISSTGAAGTMIDARSVVARRNVDISDTGAEFGRPGKGFTVTETAWEDSGRHPISDGVRINAGAVLVRGNQVVVQDAVFPSTGTGIDCHLVLDGIRIEGNLVLNWHKGIWSGSVPAAVSKNQVMHTDEGIVASAGTVTSNIVTRNARGIVLGGSARALSNSVFGNSAGFFVVSAGVVVTKNNLFGNGCGILNGDVSGLNASNNFWGVPGGPGPPPADNVCNQAGTTTTSPFATKPFVVTILKP